MALVEKETSNKFTYSGSSSNPLSLNPKTKDKRILFCGYDFEHKHPRGIGFYSRAAIKATTNLGYKNYLLTSSLYSNNCIKQTQLIVDKLLNPDKFLLGKSKKIARYIYDYFGSRNTYNTISTSNLLISSEFENKPNIRPGTSPNPILTLHSENSYVAVSQENLAYLKYISGFINKRYIYDLLKTNASISTAPYPINFEDVDLIFSINPLSIKPKKNIRLIQSLHDIIPLIPEAGSAYRSSCFFNEIKNMLHHSDVIISVSEYSRNLILNMFPEFENKIKVVYQPAPVTHYEKQIAENSELESAILNAYNLNNQSYLFYTGYIEKRKNIRRIIDAYLKVKDEIKIPLVLSGQIDNDPDLNSLIKKNVAEKKIIHLGYIPNISKLILLKNASALIFPSLIEGFGLPPLEAMQMKCPVLTSNTTSLPEITGNAAYLVDPLNTDEIAHGIKTLTNDQFLRSELIKKGEKRVQEFNQESYKYMLKKVLESVLS